jgi:competence protein ComEC
LALTVIVVFAAMTRFEPSVLRASAMTAIATLAAFAGRPVARGRVLAYAVIVLLLLDPYLLSAIAFWLSCGASAGIAFLAPALAARLPVPRVVREPLAVSLAAQVGVLPILLLTFDTFPLVTPIANLVAAPAAAALGSYGFVASALAGTIPALGPIVQRPTEALVVYISEVAHVGAAVPFAIDGRDALGLGTIAAVIASVACARARRALPQPAPR